MLLAALHVAVPSSFYLDARLDTMCKDTDYSGMQEGQAVYNIQPCVSIIPEGGQGRTTHRPKATNILMTRFNHCSLLGQVALPPAVGQVVPFHPSPCWEGLPSLPGLSQIVVSSMYRATVKSHAFSTWKDTPPL